MFNENQPAHFEAVEKSTTIKIRMMVEGEEVGVVDSTEMLKSLSLFITSLYVFNLDYPDKLKRTFSYVTGELLHIDCGAVKHDQVVRNLIKKLRE